MDKILTKEEADNLTGEHIVISEGYTEIEAGAFADRDIVSITIADSVNKMGNGVFRDCVKLKRIELPENLTVLENWTFNGCKSLTHIRIPNSVKLIGAGVFQECSNLREVVLPEGELTIYGAFEYCTSLKKICLPAGVKEIIAVAFVGCSALENILVDADNADYSDIDGVLFNKDCTVLLRYPDGKKPECTECEATYSVPGSVVEIGNHAFAECKYIKNINIPPGLAQITKFAFRETSYLPSEVDSQHYRQSKCSALRINVDSANEYYADIDGILFNKDKTILINCPKGQVHDVYEVPSGTLEIADYVFEDCTEIRSIVLPDTLIKIGDLAFIGCTHLEHIVISSSITHIGWGCLANCVRLIDIDIHIDESEHNITFKNCAVDCTAWYEAQPDGVVYLGNTAVAYKGEMPENSVITIKEGTRRIAECTFSDGFDNLMDNLVGVVIPESVIQIGEYAFNECNNLTDVIIKNSDAIIAETAFKHTAYGRKRTTNEISNGGQDENNRSAIRAREKQQSIKENYII